MASIKSSVKRHLVNDFDVQNTSGDILGFPLKTTDEARIAALEGKNYFPKGRLALTGLPTYTYDNGTAGVGATITIDANGLFSDSNSDGDQIAVNDIVMIRKEYVTVTDDAHQGIYVVTAIGDGSNPAVFTRSTDADTAEELIQNKTIYIAEGDTHSGHVYAISGDVDVVGTDAINFDEKSETPAVGEGSIGTSNLADGAVTYAKTDSTIQAQLDKVDGIETGATADQSNAEILAAWETETGRTVATDGSKLDGIESGATADQTDAEILAAFETETGRDVSVDGSKLDGIEASADVTDTANVTAAGALMDSEVVNLADVKAFDPADYATAAQGSEVAGKQDALTTGVFITLGSGTDTPISVTSGSSDVTLQVVGTSSGSYGKVNFQLNDIAMSPVPIVGDIVEVTDNAANVWNFEIGTINTFTNAIELVAASEPKINGSTSGSNDLVTFSDLTDVLPSSITFIKDGGGSEIDVNTGTVAAGSASAVPTAADVKTVTDTNATAASDAQTAADNAQSTADAAAIAGSVFTIDSSATGTGTDGVEVSYQATSTKQVIWSMVDTDTTGFEIDRIDGTLEGLCPTAGTYDIEIYATNLQELVISQKTITFTIS